MASLTTWWKYVDSRTASLEKELLRLHAATVRDSCCAGGKYPRKIALMAYFESCFVLRKLEMAFISSDFANNNDKVCLYVCMEQHIMHLFCMA